MELLRGSCFISLLTSEASFLSTVVWAQQCCWTDSSSSALSEDLISFTEYSGRHLWNPALEKSTKRARFVILGWNLRGNPHLPSRHCALGKHKIGVYPKSCQAHMSSCPGYSNSVYILLTYLNKLSLSQSYSLLPQWSLMVEKININIYLVTG